MVFRIGADPFPEALGGAISRATSSLASIYKEKKQKEFDERERRGEAFSFLKALGLPDETAKELSSLPNNQLKMYVDQYNNTYGEKAVAGERKEQRVQVADMNKDYDIRVKDVNEAMSNFTVDPKLGNKVKKRLREEQSDNLVRMQRGEPRKSEAFEEYTELFAENPQLSPDRPREQFDQQGQGQPQDGQPQKVQFDLNNPEHINYRNNILNKTGKDRKKAKAELFKVFDL